MHLYLFRSIAINKLSHDDDDAAAAAVVDQRPSKALSLWGRETFFLKLKWDI